MNKTEFEAFPYKEMETDIRLYTDDVKEQIEKAVVECTELGKNYAAANSTEEKKEQNTAAVTNLPRGTYRGSWRMADKIKADRVTGTFFNTTMVFTHYDKSYKIPLAPLLELGHAAKFPVKKYKKQREKGIKVRRKTNSLYFVEPVPKGGHIEPALDKARAELDKRIKEILDE